MRWERVDKHKWNTAINESLERRNAEINYNLIESFPQGMTDSVSTPAGFNSILYLPNCSGVPEDSGHVLLYCPRLVKNSEEENYWYLKQRMLPGQED